MHQPGLHPSGSASGFIAFAAVSGAISVIAGAFAAHGLNAETQGAEIGWLHTGSQYEALHALAMLGVAALAGMGWLNARCAVAAQWLFLVGSVLFPAALYGLVFHGPRLLGAVAPIGGTAFILGWLILAAGALVRRDS
ncbi:MAG: hypothetical protein JWM91_3706 [Rhodospirillales bacterium]|nr:hypothetical protein [Rhodospirillales bacterium]